MHFSNILGLLITILETYFFIGVFYAWPDVNKLFKDEGVFRDLCTETSTPNPEIPVLTSTLNQNPTDSGKLCLSSYVET